MVGAFLAGILLLIGFLVIGYGLANADPARVARFLRSSALYWIGGILAFGLILLAVATKNIGFLWGLLSLLIPWFLRARVAARMMKNARGPSAGNASTVRSRYLEMMLSHDSGEMDGIIREGAFAGQSLSALSLADLLDLLREVSQNDGESERLLIAYLDRMRPEWREGEEESGASSGSRSRSSARSGTMSRQEAFAVLGLEEGASAEDIKAAHRRLMATHHPDKGGSDYLAAKLNEAKEILLG